MFHNEMQFRMEHPVKSQKHNAAKVEYEFLSVCKYASAFTFRSFVGLSGDKSLLVINEEML